MNIQQHIRQLSAALLLLGASQIHAADIVWADSSGNTTWTTNGALNGTAASSSWSGGNAPVNSINTDTAIFNSVSNAQPNLTVQTRINGVDFRMAAGGLAMTGNNNLFQQGEGGINSTLQTSGINTITNARILVNREATWTLFSSTNTTSTSTFTFDSTVQLEGHLTVIGQRNSAAGNVGVINFERGILRKSDTDTHNLTISSTSTNNTVNLNGENTYLGVTNVTAGVVNVSGDQSGATGGWNIQTNTPGTSNPAATVNFATGSEIAVISANKIQIGSTSNGGSHPNSTLNVAGTVTNAGALQMERASTLNLNNGAVWSQGGNLTVTGRGGSSATLNVNAGSDMTYTGTNTVKLNKASNSSGVGGLSIDSTGVFTTGRGFQATVNTDTTARGNGRVTLTNGGTLKLSENVGTLSNEVHFELGSGGGVIDNSGFNTTLSGVVTGLYGINRNGITGTGGLTSTGSGTLTLTGVNTYTGATSVTGGTLLVNGSLHANSAVSVAANAVLGGTGTINGNVSFLEGSFLHIADISDALTVGGTVTFGNGFGINNLTGLNWDALDLNTSYTLLSGSQTFTASDIDNFGLANAAAVGTGRQAYFQDGSLQLVVIPEPSTLVLLGISLATLAAFRRRRA